MFLIMLLHMRMQYAPVRYGIKESFVLLPKTKYRRPSDERRTAAFIPVRISAKFKSSCIEVVIPPALRDELLVIAALDYPAVLQDHYGVGVPYG